MVKKKIIQTGKVTLIVFLMIFGFINYLFGILDGIVNISYPGVVLENQTNLNYLYQVSYGSSGSFIQNNKIDLEIIVTAISNNKKFNNSVHTGIILSNCNVCNYPLNYSNGICNLGINLVPSQDKTKLIGEGKIVFLSSGNCENKIYIFQDEANPPIIFLQNNLEVSPLDSWLTIKSNRAILFLTLVTIALMLVQIWFSSSKEGDKK